MKTKGDSCEVISRGARHKKFRATPKVLFNMAIPPALGERFRRHAFNRNVTVGYAVTEALASWLGEDPTKYGIEATDANK